MGISITESQYAKIQMLRQINRACVSGASRISCMTKATTNVITQTWTHAIAVGEPTTRQMKMCTRHAKQVPEGYQGTNFIVLAHAKLEKN